MLDSVLREAFFWVLLLVKSDDVCNSDFFEDWNVILRRESSPLLFKYKLINSTFFQWNIPLQDL